MTTAEIGYGGAVDWMFWSVIAGGTGVLIASARARRIATQARSNRLGMAARPDLTEVPAELQATVLWQLTEGGREHAVCGGRLSLAAHDVDITCFDLEDHRRLRAEWAWLDVAAPFRVHPPLTAIALRLPRRLPRLVIKRAGPADAIAPRAEEVRRATPGPGDVIGAAVVAVASRALQDWSQLREEPPATLGRATLIAELPAGWRAWGPPDAADADRALVAAIVGDGALAPDRELVIETLGPLVLVYAASGGPLVGEALDDVVDAAIAACERALRHTPVLGPRGVEA